LVRISFIGVKKLRAKNTLAVIIDESKMGAACSTLEEMENDVYCWNLTLILQLVEENEIVSRTGDLVDY
jgi:hypothetical protein